MEIKGVTMDGCGRKKAPCRVVRFPVIRRLVGALIVDKAYQIALLSRTQRGHVEFVRLDP